MRRIAGIFFALVVVFALALGASGATQANNVSCFATVTADGSCQVTLTATLHLEQSKDVTFPVPLEASNVTLNGSRVRAAKSDNVRLINLSNALGNLTGDVSVNISYTLRDVVHTTDAGTLELRLPLLAGFGFPINAMDFTISLPGEYPARPSFSSGYHQTDIEKDMSFTITGATLSGSFNKALKDHETLTMTLGVSEQMFPRAAVQLQSMDFGIGAMIVCGVLALLYWLLFLRTAPVFGRRTPEPPDGCSAGELGCVLHLQGVDLSAMVLSWAQLGYLRIRMDRQGRVTLHKYMDMGNERGETEQRCFKKLFGGRNTVDTTGTHYATLCQFTAKRASGIRELVHRRSGNLTVFRILCTGIGLFSGACLGFCLGSGAWLQWPLVILLAAVGAAAVWLGLDWACHLFLRGRRKLWMALGFACIWLLLWLLAGQFLLGLATVAALCLGGFLYAFGGRRTDHGRQYMAQVLGLRRYLCTVPREELTRICTQNPDYFFDLAPYALALGVGERFAKRFGKTRLTPCPYLSTGADENLTAAMWTANMQHALQAMDARSENMPLEKLIGLLQSLRR